MGKLKKRWIEERRRDFYHRKALETGYRSRAVFKLKQMDEKFGLLKEGDTVLDLGCSSGGWSQYSVERVGMNGRVIGVDTESMKPLGRGEFNFVHLDIMDHGSIDELRQAIQGQVDVVLSDLAPDMIGIYQVDVSKQLTLAKKSLEIAVNLLRRNGRLVSKVFEGSGSRSIEDETRKHFTKVSRFKPEASRKHSSEFYLVCIGFRSPQQSRTN